MDMIERLAKAIEAAHREYHPTQRDYAVMARAAMEAMREPTEEMVDAGYNETPPDVSGVRVGDIWQAMIDAALAGETSGAQK